MRLKQAYLIAASVLVSVIALAYGICPSWFASTFLGGESVSVNFAHILRAVMGLYLAFAVFWLVSAFSDKHRNIAILTTMIFSGGLVIGRLVSFLADGEPAPLLSIYAGLELAILPLAWWLYKRPD